MDICDLSQALIASLGWTNGSRNRRLAMALNMALDYLRSRAFELKPSFKVSALTAWLYMIYM